MMPEAAQPTGCAFPPEGLNAQKMLPSAASPRRPGDPPCLGADASRIKRELGWQPQYSSLESILASAWAWHKKL